MKKWQKIALIILGTYIVSAISLYVYEVVTFEAKYQAVKQLNKGSLLDESYPRDCKGKTYILWRSIDCPINRTPSSHQLSFLATSPATKLFVPLTKQTFQFLTSNLLIASLFIIITIIALITLFLKKKFKSKFIENHFLNFIPTLVTVLIITICFSTISLAYFWEKEQKENTTKLFDRIASVNDYMFGTIKKYEQENKEPESNEVGLKTYTIGASVINLLPFETAKLIKQDEEILLIQETEAEPEEIEVVLVEKYIQNIFNDNRPALSTPEPNFFLFKVGDKILIESIDIIGGMASIDFRTLFVIDLTTKKEQKLYTVRESWGNLFEGSPPEPILVTLFDKHDLIFNCQSITSDRFNPAYRNFNLDGCEGVYLVENYSKREEDLKGGTLYDYNYSDDKNFVYYDEDGKLIEPRVLSDKKGQKSRIHTRFTDLMQGQINVIIGEEREGDIYNLKNTESFKLILDY